MSKNYAIGNYWPIMASAVMGGRYISQHTMTKRSYLTLWKSM